MTLKELKPKKVLNKAFLKVKPNRSDIENFKANLVTLLDRINDAESEEFHKNLVIDFLKKTYYDPNYFVNTKGRNDLVIHNGEKAKSTVGVIIEAKKPTNKAEMITVENINKKAFQELVLYYLRERITHKNLEIKHLVATNINEWFIFDVVLFERLFAQNKGLVKQFEDFEAGRLADIKTDFFYKQIAEPFISELKSEIEFTYFNIQDYQKPLRNNDKKDDNTLIALFKLLSPEHLLKVPFANDSNRLDKRFYAELLHIIGLTETKDGGKKLIGRNIEKDRNSSSILEDAIIQLDSLDKLSRLPKSSQYGSNTQEKLFSVALELSITWINRILFLKLLEAQLISYHKGDVSYAFLSYDRIKNFDDLNSLFFQVLAKKYEDRNSDVKSTFEKVPYLNSSLFEPTEIEQHTLFISNLRDDKTLPIFSQTVLKDQQGKKRTGNITTLEYLFEFLNAYDFSSEGSEDIQEDNKTLINASVLGLIFEKINGYKDGSFFTPGFITMYMCRETLRKSVVQKFNELKNWNCTNLEDLYDKIEDRTEANAIVNSIKICDPAVGSGHFLVSALNEMIAIKNDLKILQDRDFKRLKEYQVEVVNDELVITDEDGGLFDYNPNNKESQRIQETLFHEKQAIIENCLFGVDINANSVKICRLRLWIELLKNAYYKNPTELETLPNIDINIKNGNSLVSRFALDADLKTALKSSKWNISSYRLAVNTYRNAENKEQKREMEQLIADIKSDFRSEISLNDPKLKKYRKVTGDLFMMTKQPELFEMSKKEKSVWNKRVETLTKESKKLETEIEEIKANKIYENAFEWRFEFPEMLNDEGDFIGFDVVLGNPPYVQLQKMGKESDDLGRMGFETFAKTGDIYSLFYELGYNVLKQSGLLTYITSNKWMRAGYGENTRKFFVEKTNPLVLIDFGGVQIFDSATVDTNILMLSKESNQFKTLACVVKDKALKDLSDYVRQWATITHFKTSDSWVVLSEIEQRIKNKIEAVGTPLKDWDINIYRGILTGYNEAFIIDGKKKDELIAEDPKSAEIIRPLLRGRDIKRYSYEFADLYLLFIPWHFPLQNNPNITGSSLEAEKAFENQYPAIYTHLLKYKKELSNRNKAETGIRYEWYALQRWGANYWEDFSKQKITYIEIMTDNPDNGYDFPCFSFDANNCVALNTAYIMTGDVAELKYILGILNSKLGRLLVKYYVVQLQQRQFRMLNQYVVNFPIPKNKDLKPISSLVDKINNSEKYSQSIIEFEILIDNLVFQLYSFNAEEIEYIKNN